MGFKFLKENLPWIAPSAAIVFAANGYFDRQQNVNPAEPVAALSAPAPAFIASVDAPQQPVRPAVQSATVTPAPNVSGVEVSRSVEPTVAFNTITSNLSATDVLTPKQTLTEVVPLVGETGQPVPKRTNVAAAFMTPENVAPRVAPNIANNPAAFLLRLRPIWSVITLASMT